MGITTYYHYTDRKGLIAILNSRKILMSGSGRFGPGVYLTKLSPTHGRKKVAQNNWDGVWGDAEGDGKADYAISVKLGDHTVTSYANDTIFVSNEDVHLDMTEYMLYSKHGDHEELELDQ